MPPLKAEKFEATPLSEEEKALREQQLTMIQTVYQRMDTILPYTYRPIRGQYKEVVSSKAVYQVDGQPEYEYTRAWLRRRVDFKQSDIDVITDRVVVVGDVITLIKGSQHKHLALGHRGTVYSSDYFGFSTQQSIELLQSLADTVDLIEAANGESAIANAPVEHAVGW